MVWTARQSVRPPFRYTGPSVYHLLITMLLSPVPPNFLIATGMPCCHHQELCSHPYVCFLLAHSLNAASCLSSLSTSCPTRPHQNLQSNPSSCPLHFSLPSLYSMVWHSKHCVARPSPLQLQCSCMTGVQSWLLPALHYFKSALQQQMWLKIKPLIMPALSSRDDHKPQAAMWDTKQSLCPFQTCSFSCSPNTMLYLLLSP